MNLVVLSSSFRSIREAKFPNRCFNEMHLFDSLILSDSSTFTQSWKLASAKRNFSYGTLVRVLASHLHAPDLPQHHQFPFQAFEPGFPSLPHAHLPIQLVHTSVKRAVDLQQLPFLQKHPQDCFIARTSSSFSTVTLYHNAVALIPLAD